MASRAERIAAIREGERLAMRELAGHMTVIAVPNENTADELMVLRWEAFRRTLRNGGIRV